MAQVAERIKELPEIMEVSPAELAGEIGLSEEEYTKYENAQLDILHQRSFMVWRLFWASIPRCYYPESLPE